jgi:hypothetical protein
LFVKEFHRLKPAEIEEWKKPGLVSSSRSWNEFMTRRRPRNPDREITIVCK